MALLWCDGFDHYGTDENNLTDGVYANNGTCVLSTTQVATGTRSILVNGTAFGGDHLRKVLPAATTKMGATARFYFETLPPTNSLAHAFIFHGTTATNACISCVVDAQGALRFYRGSNFFVINGQNGTLIATTDPIIVANAWNHIEVQINISNTVGWIRVAVNGVHRYEATGLDTDDGSVSIRSVGHCEGYSGEVGSVTFYMDDLILYDFTGTAAVDTDFCPTVDGSGVGTNYIGELQCMYLPPNADTAEADWTPSTGVSEYAMIDETTPNDADYVSSTTVGDLSEYALTDLPPEITYVRGLQVIGRMSKSDAGSARTKFGMKSVAATTDAAERPLTTEATYWWDFINVDPNSSARWTRPSLNAAWVRLTRSV